MSFVTIDAFNLPRESTTFDTGGSVCNWTLFCKSTKSRMHVNGVKLNNSNDAGRKFILNSTVNITLAQFVRERFQNRIYRECCIIILIENSVFSALILFIS